MKKLLLTAFVFLSIILFSCKKNETHQTNSPVQYLPTSNPEGRNQEGTILLGISKRFVQQNTYGIEWTTIRYIPNTSFVSSYTDSFSALPANGYPGSKSFYYTYSYDNAFNLLGILDANDTIKIISNNLGQVQKLYGGTGFESYHYNDASQIINDSTFIYPNNNLDGYVNYSYDNIGNLVQASVWNNSVDSTIFQNEADVYFSYDNHPNPFYPIKYINYSLITGFFQSPNNNIYINQIEHSGSLQSADSIRYSYNSFGYPKFSIDGSSGDTTRYYYY